MRVKWDDECERRSHWITYWLLPGNSNELSTRETKSALARCRLHRSGAHDPQDLRQPGLGIGRDRSRTPMPWDDAAYAGFSTVDPWLPLNEDWRVRNFAAQDRDSRSLLSLYRSVLALRQSHDALAIGDVTLVDAAEDVLVYQRRYAGECLLIALNLSDETRPLSLPTSLLTDTCDAEVLVSTRPLRPMDGTLAPDEGLVLRPKEKR